MTVVNSRQYIPIHGSHSPYAECPPFGLYYVLRTYIPYMVE